MADHIDDLCVIDEAPPPLPPRRRAPHTSGLRAAVRIAIVAGDVAGARNAMAQHSQMDWAVEEGMLVAMERAAA